VLGKLSSALLGFVLAKNNNLKEMQGAVEKKE